MKNVLLFLLLISVNSYAVENAVENAEDKTELSLITVEGEIIEGISGSEVKTADLAEALSKKSASISLVRRSGIANDIILRGQKKDNINILIDGAKVYGACPNRMDPPTSHILTNNIESVEITEGPYDVENFGTLSGSVLVITKKPATGFNADLMLNIGSWNYLKTAASLSGGTDRIRALISVSSESSDQYEDGDGNNFAEQIENFSATTMARYKPEYENRKAYEKQSVMAKLYFDVTDNQQLKMSYTANRSDDVLYPSSKMDALYDDSDIINIDYSVSDLGRFSSLLDFSYYDSVVKHPMSTFYRLSSGPDSANERVSYLESSIRGFKLKNVFDISPDSQMTLGIDSSNRNWDGTYEGSGMSAGITGIKSIDDVDTDNNALFLRLDKNLGDMSFEIGARYDDTDIKPGAGMLPANDYTAFSAYGLGNWKLNPEISLFAGLGQSHRVPDARELYFRAAMGPNGMLIGNPNLDQVTNDELDFGFDYSLDNLHVKTRLFYSWLSDFIVYNDSKSMQRFENADASIYGFSVSGYWRLGENLNLDYGLAYQRGKKDRPLAGQSDTDLPEIPPIKLNLALRWNYTDKGTAWAELTAADSWTDYDADNGEQLLDSWAIFNLKAEHQLTKRISILVGVDNLFDETYAVSNTYKDLTLLLDGTGEVILMNEPGRYFYLNTSFSF